MTLYSDITNNLVSYSNILSNFSTYTQLNSYVPYMSGAGYGEYELQLFKYQPIAYWSVTTSENAAIEPSVFGSDAEIEKISGTDGYRPIIYSADAGTNILFSEDYLLLSTVEFNKIKVAKSSYAIQPFTINFWYKNLNNVLSTDEAILEVGEVGDYKILLYTKNGKFVLNFLGQTSFVEVDDYRSTYNISIIFNGSSSSLIVNGVQGTTISNISGTFNAAPFAMWKSGFNCQTIFSHISFFGYPLSLAQSRKLYEIGSKSTPHLNNLYVDNLSSMFDNTISNYYSTINFEFSENTILRNCNLNNDVLSLSPKKMASLTNATFATNKYSIGSGGSIAFEISDNDFDINSASFKVTSTNLSASSGTLMYLACSQPITVSVSSGNLNVYSTVSDTAIFNQAIAGGTTYVAIELINGQIWINVNGNKTNTEISSPNAFTSVIIGNKSDLSDNYTGYVSDFTLNYAENPLQIGIYKLDLNVLHTDYVKPKQDGVAVFQVYALENTSINFARFKSSGAAEVRKFTTSNTESEYLSCLNGSVINDGDSLTDTQLTQDTVYLLSARLYDNVSSNSYEDIELPKISNFRYHGYYNSDILSMNSPVKITSNVDNPYSINSFYDNEIKFKTNSAINIDGTFVGGNAKMRSVMFYIKPSFIPNTGTLMSLGSTNLILTKINANSYTLKVDSGAVYVNRSAYSPNNPSETLYINDWAYIVIILPSQVDVNITMTNMNNISIADLAISPENTYLLAGQLTNARFAEKIMVVSDPSTLSITDEVLVKAFTSNIVFSG